MKTYKQLFEIILKEYDTREVAEKYGFMGKHICVISNYLVNIKISEEEYRKLQNYVMSHRPKIGKFYESNNGSAFWGEEDPIRREWILHQIKKLSKKGKRQIKNC